MTLLYTKSLAMAQINHGILGILTTVVVVPRTLFPT